MGRTSPYLVPVAFRVAVRVAVNVCTYGGHTPHATDLSWADNEGAPVVAPAGGSVASIYSPNGQVVIRVTRDHDVTLAHVAALTVRRGDEVG